MTAFDLKCIAIVAMVIDHIGLFFFPQVAAFRMIGRLAFPLFAWLIANGAHHTKNLPAHMGRIFLFAVLSQLPFSVANYLRDKTFWGLNILFTFFLALAVIFVLQKTKNTWARLSTVLFCLMLSQVGAVDYGALGVASVLAYFLFFDKKKSMAAAQCVLFFLPVFAIFIFGYHAAVQFFRVDPVLELFGLPALFLIAAYNGKEGIKAKYAFYLFYPTQYILLAIVKGLITK